MRAKIKRIHSPDVHNLEEFEPPEAGSFSILLQLMIGPEDGPGEESFDVTLCTPQWLSDNLSEQDVLLGRHHVLVLRYDFDRIRQRLERYVGQFSGDSWSTLADKLRCLGKWEFEDYSPYQPNE